MTLTPAQANVIKKMQEGNDITVHSKRNGKYFYMIGVLSVSKRTMITLTDAELIKQQGIIYRTYTLTAKGRGIKI